MNSTFTRGLTALVLTTLAACGGDATPPAVTPAPSPTMPTPASTQPNAPSTSLDAPAPTPLPSGYTLSQEGGDCGDDAAVKKKCATGLMCTPAAGGAAGAPGKCTKAKL